MRDPLLDPLLKLKNADTQKWSDRLDAGMALVGVAERDHPNSELKVCVRHEVMTTQLCLDDLGYAAEVLERAAEWDINTLERVECGGCLLSARRDALIAQGKYDAAKRMIDDTVEYLQRRLEDSTITQLERLSFCDLERLRVAALEGDAEQGSDIEERNERGWLRLIRHFERLLEGDETLSQASVDYCKRRLNSAREATDEGAIYAALARGEHEDALRQLDEYLDAYEDGGVGLTKLIHTMGKSLYSARAWGAVAQLAPIASARFKARGYWRWLADLLTAQVEAALDRDDRVAARVFMFELEDVEDRLTPGSLRETLERLSAAL